MAHCQLKLFFAHFEIASFLGCSDKRDLMEQHILQRSQGAVRIEPGSYQLDHQHIPKRDIKCWAKFPGKRSLTGKPFGWRKVWLKFMRCLDKFNSTLMLFSIWYLSNETSILEKYFKCSRRKALAGVVWEYCLHEYSTKLWGKSVQCENLAEPGVNT